MVLIPSFAVNGHIPKAEYRIPNNIMPEPLKDQLYSRDFFERLTEDFLEFHPYFPAENFLESVFDKNWPNLELKERMRHSTLALHQVYPLPYPEAIELFKQVIGAKAGDGFAKMIFPDYVEVFGLDNLEISLDALKHFTPHASGEFAIRPFILKYGQPVIDRMLEWAEDDNYHVRRLASEGCRPRLPWAMALPAFKKDPRPIIPILEKLKADPEDFVRRSVANNLNDISKDNPKLALELAMNWKGQSEETDWIVKHGCRTLLKQGVTEALILFGFEDPALVNIRDLAIDNATISIGHETNFSFIVDNNDQHPALLRLEYSIDYVKKTGKMSRKIFQITEKTFSPGRTPMQRKLSFQNLSTRIHYPGEHLLRIITNGQEKAQLTFELTD